MGRRSSLLPRVLRGGHGVGTHCWVRGKERGAGLEAVESIARGWEASPLRNPISKGLCQRFWEDGDPRGGHSSHLPPPTCWGWGLVDPVLFETTELGERSPTSCTGMKKKEREKKFCSGVGFFPPPEALAQTYFLLLFFFFPNLFSLSFFFFFF